MLSLPRTYLNKVRNKLQGVVRVPHQGVYKGDVLLSYMTAPFTQAPGEYFTDPHTNYWECTEMARLFSLRGYAVDVINASNHTFTPRKKYVACIDANANLERFASLLPRECKKVLHITFSYGAFQTQAEEGRLAELYARRGIQLSLMRKEPVTRSPMVADFLEGFGNSSVHKTYAQFNKPIFPIPISVTQEFPFQERKDWSAARTHFLWFGGGGAILKGLDLMVEAFAEMPEYTLHIVGPAAFEPEFEKVYANELSIPNIIRYPRPRLLPTGEMRIGDTPFLELMNMCASLIYPSASEGTSGAVIQAMHASVIPIVTKETGIPDQAPLTLLPEASITAIQAAAHRIAATDSTQLQSEALAAWEYAKNHHTKKTFSTTYASFIDSGLHL